MTRRRKSLAVLIALGAFTISNAQPSSSQTVKVTPLGSHDNEFCALDRALIFEAMLGEPCADRRILASEISMRCC